MTKELAKKAKTEVVAQDEFMDAFGVAPISSSDVVIPKILAMQGLSEMVIEGKAKFGDFVDSVSQEVIGGMDKPLLFIPFHLEKIWIISKWNGSKYEFSSIEAVTAMNENKKWEEETPEGKFKNEKCFNFYSLRPDSMELPVIISFKGTSQKAGRELATQMYVKNRAAGKNPVAKTMSLVGSKVSNDKGTYVVLKTTVARDTTREEMVECVNWFKTVQSGDTKTDNSDVKGAGQANTPNPQF